MGLGFFSIQDLSVNTPTINLSQRALQFFKMLDMAKMKNVTDNIGVSNNQINTSILSTVFCQVNPFALFLALLDNFNIRV